MKILLFVNLLICMPILFFILFIPEASQVSVEYEWPTIIKSLEEKPGLKKKLTEERIRLPYHFVQAEEYSLQSGIKREFCSEGGYNIGWIQDGDWAAYKGIEFRAGNPLLVIRAASPKTNSKIDIRLDSPEGRLIGSCEVLRTGAWQTWKTLTCALEDVRGIHDLYLVFRGSRNYLVNLNWLAILFHGQNGIEETRKKLNQHLSGQNFILNSEINVLFPVVLVFSAAFIIFGNAIVLIVFKLVNRHKKFYLNPLLEPAKTGFSDDDEKSLPHRSVKVLSYSDTDLKKIMQIILEHYTQPGFSSGVIYELSGISPSRTAKLINDKYSMTFKQLLNDIRIREIKRLLKETDLNINDMVARTGYQNINYFNRLFKRLTGLSPSQYRQRSRQSSSF